MPLAGARRRWAAGAGEAERGDRTQGDPDGVSVAAEAGKEFIGEAIGMGMCGGECIEQMKAGNGAAGAVGLAFLVGEDQRGPAGSLDDT